MKVHLFMLVFLLSGCVLTDIEDPYERVPLPVEHIDILAYREGQLYVRTYGKAPDACTSYDTSEITSEDAHTYRIRNTGKRNKNALCAQVLTPYTADIRILLPGLGTYRLIFWPGTVDTVLSLPMATK